MVPVHAAASRRTRFRNPMSHATRLDQRPLPFRLALRAAEPGNARALEPHSRYQGQVDPS